MIIDFHTHTFPDKIAQRAICQLSQSGNVSAYTDGTAGGLIDSSINSNIALSIIQPVVTKPSQTETVNNQAITWNQQYPDTSSRLNSKDRIYYFGGVHPDNENYKEILDNLKANGVKGIKLHPPFHKTYADDIRYLHILDYAATRDLMIMLHAGIDISAPCERYSDTAHIYSMLKQVSPPKLILAHMGGLFEWDKVLPVLADFKPYIDTSFAFESNADKCGMSGENFCKFVHTVGSDKVLFGTDSPWAAQAYSVQAINNSGLTKEELSKIFFTNAAKLLDITDNLFTCVL